MPATCCDSCVTPAAVRPRDYSDAGCGADRARTTGRPAVRRSRRRCAPRARPAATTYSAVNGSAPGSAPRPSLATNSTATSHVSGSRVPAQPRHEARPPCSRAARRRNPRTTRARGSSSRNPALIAADRSEQRSPATAAARSRARTGHQTSSTPSTFQPRCAASACTQVAGHQAPGLAVEHGGALVAQAWRGTGPGEIDQHASSDSATGSAGSRPGRRARDAQQLVRNPITAQGPEASICYDSRTVQPGARHTR